MTTADTLAELAHTSKAWPFEEARKLLKRLEKADPAREVVFETGYGPSGLPHIGTFGEVARTSMVRHALEALKPGVKTRLVCFSDDMDGLRKVPTNVPNQELLQAALEKPLTAVPDPFGTHPSFGAHNNARLRSFLDSFGFQYEFLSATECYRSGMFDETLLRMLAVYDDVMAIILPTLGPDRRATYSPFLPISPNSGKVLQVPIEARDLAAGTIVYTDPDTGKRVETLVTGGHVKCQWKADWAMRWVALGVDYEMAGKDLIDSVTLSSKVARALGGRPPEGFNYELFLDDQGQKISKSKGNGIAVEEWLAYATPESLSLYMFQKPKTAKRLHFDVIPKAVDEYFTLLGAFHKETPQKQIENAVWHIHGGTPPQHSVPLTFGLLLNLVSASNAHTKDILWQFVKNYATEANAEDFPELDRLIGFAIRYFEEQEKPFKVYRAPSDLERAAMLDLSERLATADASLDAEALQGIVYEVGKSHPFENLRDWFKALYEVLFGESAGPRFGSFIKAYGIDNTRALIAERLAIAKS
ncbi:lysine--tRNA ligase [Rhodomicrobium vannielii ATCC 17100]|uniref:lysine--tRNA ligase n=1 Tax=Rhodomicrobium vannielii TaxID=1069 RepID=UPI0019189F3F|nr:lysine--tRNA ligase [Rhodomicrobium vannielii]MBJ7534734.1 lysine--tRNA ligase [Rhodomicrobium vannielii ATCC 17100]